MAHPITSRPVRALLGVLVAVLLAATLGAAADARPAAAADAPDVVTIAVLSNRADLISGGDALVEVLVPAGADVTALRLDVDGRDVSEAFAVRPNGRFMGLVTGLALGENLLTATLPDGSGAHITITNHPLGGPIFSGPQIQPWTCAAGALDEQCNREPTYQFLYRSTRGGKLRAYDPASPPSDVATTTTDEGNEVPFIVRQETGAIVRDQYRIAVLYDPTQPFEPWAPQEGFNDKLVITHGASCDTSYAQGSAPDVLLEDALSRGFAVMSHALDNAGHNCNIITQAESLISTKEYLVERYGELRYTIGSGCSGGSLVQQQVANAYPGVYQGITPACSFTDAWSSAQQYVDYELLRAYFERPQRWSPGTAWEPLAIGEVLGHVNPANPVTFTEVIPAAGDPSRACPGLAAAQVYEPDSNPEGVRCSLQDYMVNIFGTRAEDGFAQRPFDNVGIEYGRTALERGALTAQQFVDVNAVVGALDIDYNPQAARVEADRPALATVFRSGAVNTADNLDQVAIIDLRGPDPGAFHDVYRTYVMRARLEREHGTAANQVLWRGSVPLFGDTTYVDAAIVAVDKWLAAVAADTRDVPLAQKIIEDRPADVTDRCTTGAGQAAPTAYCDQVVESYSSPRIAAGMPLTDDVIKCTLQPLDRSTYPVTFSDAQWARMEAAFPNGVCDYSVPGVDQQPVIAWMTYEAGPHGQPLGPVPVSVPFAPGGAARLVRHAGPGRLDTAVAVSGRGLATADTVVLARADAYPDALAGGPLAVHLDAPLLLTASDALSAATAGEIRRLGAEQVVLLGGEAALAPQVADDLTALGVTSRRVAGATRYATAAAIAAELPAAGEVLVARVDAFPDALSASAVGSGLGLPILLVESGRLPDETAAALDAGVDVTVVGGSAAVADSVVTALDARAATVARVAGSTRYATSALMAQQGLDRGLTPAQTWVATGADFPDALVAGAAAGRDRGILVLVDGRDLAGSGETAALLAAQADRIATLHLAGGTAALSPAVEATLRALLG